MGRPKDGPTYFGGCPGPPMPPLGAATRGRSRNVLTVGFLMKYVLIRTNMTGGAVYHPIDFEACVGLNSRPGD
jgi:hypothetical protein